MQRTISKSSSEFIDDKVHIKELLVTQDLSSLARFWHKDKNKYQNLIFLNSQKSSISKETDSRNSSKEDDRFSILSCNPILVLKQCRKEQALLIDCKKNSTKFIKDPLAIIDKIINKYKLSQDTLKTLSQRYDFKFFGGFLGYICYDYMNHLPKKIEQRFKDDLYVNIPILNMAFYGNALIEDNLTNKIYVVGCLDSSSFEAFYQQVVVDFNSINEVCIVNKDEASVAIASELVKHGQNDSKQFNTSISKQGYLDGLNAVHEEIRKGNVYQINYTQRFNCQFNRERSYDLFEVLNSQNPAPYAAFLNFVDFDIVSSSPECFFKVENSIISTRPIKGTIKRTGNIVEDNKLKKQLENSEKDRSELLMIVDLERNDLGKFCKYGSVKVTELFKIEEHATLYHLVSEVQGEIRKSSFSWKNIIEAMFPGGSITGAPKIASMETIANLEKVPRELYTGSIGYISVTNDANFNIVIRTIVCKNDEAYFYAGGGIVWDSDNESEYEESLLKVKALKRAISCLK